MPLVRHGVAEGVQAALRLVGVACQWREDHARRADRECDDAGLHRADAGRLGGLVAAAADHGRPGLQTGLARCVAAHDAGDLRAFVHGREPFRRDIQRAQHLFGPFAPGDVKQHRARRPGQIGRVAAGELEADVVFRQQDVRDPRVDVRLVLAHPQDLGGGEAGQGAVSGELDEPLLTDGGVDLVALGLRALVVPQDRRAQHLAALVQADQPVHLPRQADAAHPAGGQVGLPQRLADSAHDSVPPLLRILLDPVRARRLVAVADLALAPQIAGHIEHHAFAALGADVDPQNHVYPVVSQSHRCHLSIECRATCSSIDSSGKSAREGGLSGRSCGFLIRFALFGGVKRSILICWMLNI